MIVKTTCNDKPIAILLHSGSCIERMLFLLDYLELVMCVNTMPSSIENTAWEEAHCPCLLS